MTNESRAERKAREDSKSDAKQSPLGFFTLGQSYIQSANVLAVALEDPANDFKPSYHHPVRHLYAHGWELCLKACLLEQGWQPSRVRDKFGHKLCEVWKYVERDRFPSLRLTDDLERVLRAMDQCHPSKLYAYPVADWQIFVTFRYLKEVSERLLISMPEVKLTFSPGHGFPKPQ